MRRILSALTAMTLLSTSAWVSAAPLFSATYEGAYGGLNIEMVRELNAKGNGQYELYSKAKSFMASIEERSLFTFNQTQLHPNEYFYKRKVFGVKKEEALQFDWTAKVVTYLKNGEQQSTNAVTEDLLDPSLYQLTLQKALAKHPSQERFTVSFARRSQFKTYTFEQVGKTPITVQGKQYQAIELKRTNDGDEKETQLWFIPELDFTLAKILHTEDDEQHSITLTHYQASTAAGDFLKK